MKQMYTLVSSGATVFCYEEGKQYNRTVYFTANILPHLKNLDVPFIVVKTDNPNLVTILCSKDSDAIKLAVEIIRNQYPEDILEEYKYERV